MPDLMAIVSKQRFEAGGELPSIGQRLNLDRYSSANKILNALEDGGRLFMVTARPGEELWLVAVLVDPKFDGQEWIAAPSDVPIVDITHLRDKLKFKTGKGISGSVGLGAALQTPRQISDGDRALLDAAIAKAPVAASGPAPIVNRRPGEEERLYHHFELSKSARSACATCGEGIGKGALRLAEVYMHGDIRNPIYRYHHMSCGVTAVPLVMRNALTANDAGVNLVGDRAELLAQVEVALDHERLAKRAAFTARVADSAITREAAIGVPSELLAQLDEDPDDLAVLEVLADELQAKGDPRGELISVQMAIAAQGDKPVRVRAPEIIRGRIARDERVVPVDEGTRLVDRNNALTKALSPTLDPGDRSTWGIGFVKRLELAAKTATRLDEMAGVWQHPSLRMLRELRIEFGSAREGAPSMPLLVEVAPRTVRRLELGPREDYFLGQFSTLVAALPRLETFDVRGAGDYGDLAHPTLTHLIVHLPYYREQSVGVVGRLMPKQLPAVRKLTLRGNVQSLGDVIDGVVFTGWLDQLAELAILEAAWTEEDVARFAAALGKRKLKKLDVTTLESIPMKLHAKLATLCTELVFPVGKALANATTDGLLVEHTGKPEWGIGKVVKRSGDKVEVKFPKVGVKVFKADAPFLKLS